jgi:transcriptional regulator with GAF, ATPase, and Fis domain
LDDNGIQARLSASIGLERGKDLQRYAVGSLSLIGQVILNSASQVATRTQRETTTMTTSFMDNMNMQVAFPLRLGTEVLGAIDFQSSHVMRLDKNDLLTFQALADSFALLVDSVRQFETTQKRAEENEKLAEKARAALAEVQRLNKRLIGRAWSDYLKENDDLTGVTLDATTGKVAEQRGWTEGQQYAVSTDKVYSRDNVIAVPLRVRGQVMGAMEIELLEGDIVDPDELSFLQEIGERFGLAAENARLIEQSQRTAQRESLINVVSSRIQTTTNVESTLAEAARSLNEFLQAEKVVIRLGKPDNEKPSRAIEGVL